MNCHTFQSMVVDLVRGEGVDSSLVTQCWAHASNCAPCAELLLEQEKLAAGLESLASRTEKIPIPERIESVLRCAFRAQLTSPAGRAAEKALVSRPVRPAGVATSRLAWAMAIAAAVLIISAAIIAHWRQKSARPSMAQANPAGPAEQSPPAQRHAAPPSATANTHSAAPRTPASTTRSSRRPLEKKSNSKARPANPVRQNPNDVMASDFIWLPYSSGLPLDDGWAMVRVTVPRTEVASLGVSLGALSNDQAAAETLKADVLLGHDGLARAIRFVQ